MNLAMGALVLGASACGTATSASRFEDAGVLVAERDEWRGAQAGPVALRLHIEATVDTRSEPSRAASAMVVHASLTRFGAAGEVTFAVPVPRSARLVEAVARGIAGQGGVAGAVIAKTPRANVAVAGADDVVTLDPGQRVLNVAVDCGESEVVEVLVRLEVPGTLVSDARPVGLVGMPVGEILYRYDLPNDTVGTFRTSLAGARPVVTDKDGRRLIALYAKDLAALPTQVRAQPIARYVTVSASPKGYDQAFASDWAVATDAYRRRLVEASADLSDGYAVPFSPTAAQPDAGVREALAWVQARTGRSDGEAAWDAARKLPAVIAKNDLTAVDRTHLLAWVLREARLPFAFAMARRGTRVPLEPDLPLPDAFEVPLLVVGGVVLDPGCATCAPGQVRASLARGQALVLPVAAGAKAAHFLSLPDASPEASPSPKATE
ncbi:MAG: hypothetical protein JNJ59_26730 [Deltaproteobacteria bacterium]|nr:hypothetical protein [Deltaproteobacteria bacterium]